MKPRHLLSLEDLSREDLTGLVRDALRLKTEIRREGPRPHLAGRSLVMIFDKPSTRTRVSFEVAMYQLGGQSMFIGREDSQLGRGETVEDTARVLSRYVHAIVVRTYAQDDLEAMAGASSVPIINGLTDLRHPCQVLTDIMTVAEHRGSLDGVRVAWIGDGNNMAHSWIAAAGALGFPLALACPRGYEPEPEIVERARARGAEVRLTDDPMEAAQGAHVINTDVWASMGQESETARRRKVFRPYQVNAALMARAAPDAVVMHCLPAHRGEEITEEVMDGPQSLIYDEAENRLHMAKAILVWCIGAGAA
jgi:ornithine carbamoyltransferase